MPQVSPAQNSFAGGEWGPMLYARSDVDRYAVACRRLENYIATPHGPALRRSGSRFVAPVRDSSKSTRLVPFTFNTIQAYIIEFGDQYFRFYRNRAPITEDPMTITNITQGSPGVVTATAHGFSNGDEVVIEDVSGMVEVNQKRFIVANASTNQFSLSGTDTGSFTAYVSGGTASRIYTVAHEYTEAELFTCNFVQSADIMWITHPSHPMRTLSRTGHTAWSWSLFPTRDGPYLPANATATTLTMGATTGTGVTCTASATTGINDDQGFLITDIGRVIRFRHNNSSAWGWGYIASVSSTTVCTIDIEKDFSGVTASTEWRLGIFSDTTGYPCCATFFEDRLAFAGSTNFPNRIDMSFIGDYDNFQPDDQSGTSTVLADNAVSFTLVSRRVNAVRWMVEDDQGLLLGTTGGEWVIRSTNEDAVSATNPPAARKQSNHGSANIAPIEADRAVLFVAADNKELREMAFVFEDDGFRAPEMTLLADQITDKRIVEMDYQKSPHSVIWCVLNDGTLAGFTYERDQDVNAWHRHVFGGQSDAQGVQAKVESVAVIDKTDQTRDEPWIIVQRYINGQVVRYIEFIEDEWSATSTKEDAFFVDSGLTYDGAAVATIFGLEHLEGETIKIWIDGAAHPDREVTNGAVTLERSGNKIHAGLHKPARLSPLAIEGGSRDGSSAGKVKQIEEVAVRVLNSIGGKLGPGDGSLDPIPDLNFWDPDLPGDTAPELVNGWVIAEAFPHDPERDALVDFEVDIPAPSIVQAMRYTLEVQPN